MSTTQTRALRHYQEQARLALALPRRRLVRRVPGSIPGTFAWVYWVRDLSEYQVDLFRDWHRAPDATYYTDDLGDAVATAGVMVQPRGVQS